MTGTCDALEYSRQPAGLQHRRASPASACVAAEEPEVHDHDGRDEDPQDQDELALGEQVGLARLVDQVRDLEHRPVHRQLLELHVDDQPEHDAQRRDRPGRASAARGRSMPKNFWLGRRGPAGRGRPRWPRRPTGKAAPPPPETRDGDAFCPGRGVAVAYGWCPPLTRLAKLGKRGKAGWYFPRHGGQRHRAPGSKGFSLCREGTGLYAGR